MYNIQCATDHQENIVQHNLLFVSPFHFFDMTGLLRPKTSQNCHLHTFEFFFLIFVNFCISLLVSIHMSKFFSTLSPTSLPRSSQETCFDICISLVNFLWSATPTLTTTNQPNLSRPHFWTIYLLSFKRHYFKKFHSAECVYFGMVISIFGDTKSEYKSILLHRKAKLLLWSEQFKKRGLYWP